MVLNEEQWIKELREKRIAYGISQGRLAVASGITRECPSKNGVSFNKTGKVTIPNHKGDVDIKTVNSILKQAGLK